MAYTIENLKLNVEEARKGRTWLLLPEEYRSHPLAKEYPLPSRLEELQALSLIPLPSDKNNCGVVYLRRAMKEWKAKLRAKTGSALNIEGTEQRTLEMEKEFERKLAAMEAQVQNTVGRVQDAADKAIASLDDLFRLGREGLEGQMKAHLAGEDWQGETITAGAFRQCFRMVAQSVKGLGLPSEERGKAREVILEEAAASLRGTQAALAMREPTEGEPS